MTRTQQFALYAAEETCPRGEEFATLTQLDEWVRARVLDAPWFHERFPRVDAVSVHGRPAGVHDSVGGYFADTRSGQIEMARSHWCARDVCHELAHVVASPQGGHGHGPCFVRCYLTLIYLTQGSEAYVRLRTALLDAGIVIDERDDA